MNTFRDIAEASHAAYEIYQDELDMEITHFREYDCAFLPTMRLRCTLLLEGLRKGIVDIEHAELALADLRIGLDQMREYESDFLKQQTTQTYNED